MNLDCAERVVPLRTRRKVDPLIRKLGLALALSALAAASLAACGSSGSSSSSTPSTAATTSTGTSTAGGGGGATISVTADPSGQLAYTATKLTAKAGNDTIDFQNQSPLSHNVTIADSTGNVVGATDTVTGSTSTTVDLKPGTYSFYCTVDSHEAAGMKGTLTVN